MGTLLVAREVEVEAVRLAVAASPGEGRGLVVYGEAGVGKTTLVRGALEGLPVREGGCLATLQWAPYLALRRAFGSDLPEQIWTGDPEHITEQVQALLGTDVLHIDDVQWADPGTEQVLAMLAGRCRLVTTVRRGDPRAPEALEHLVEAGLERLDLEPLDAAAAEELIERLRPQLPALEVASLVNRSGGNPLLIEELADADADIATLNRALLARCRQLPEAQLDDLALLALAGQPLPAADLADAPRLVESGIVVRQGDQVAIRHALIAEVLDDLLSQERQRLTHLRLAELLPHPGEQARHLLAAGQAEEAHRAAVAAVARSATPGERIAHLETAAACLDPVEGAEFRLRAAEEAAKVDRADMAVELLDGLPDRPDLRFRIARQRFQMAAFVGQTDELAALADTELELAEPGTADEVLALMDQNFAIIVSSGEPEQLARARAIAERAVELSGNIDAERSAALKSLGDTLYVSGDEGWREVLPSARTWAVAEGNIAREWRIANNEISALQTFGPMQEGLALADEMAAKFESLRLTRVRRYFEFRRISLLLTLAEYDEILQRAPELLELPGMPAMMESDLTCILAEALIHTGRREDGFALLASGVTTSTDRGRVDTHRILAEAHLDANRPDLALEELAKFDGFNIGVVFHTEVAATRAWTARALGLEAPPRPEMLPETGLFGGLVPELDGIDAVRAEENVTAGEHFLEASERYWDSYVTRGIRCLWFAGEAFRLAADPRAEQTLLRAEAEAVRHQLVPVRIHCERSLRALGVHRSAQVVRSEDSPLTEREQEIAALAADGYTDTEIAHRLGLQRRTVQTVLASARKKLGAENRAHLIRLVTESAR